jgi:N-acetylmuramoyl-L-alanine amidase
LLFPALLAATAAFADEAPTPVFYVVLDAGHGGADTGIKREAGTEKELTLRIAMRVAALLGARPGIGTALTRKGDDPISLDERRRIANSKTPGIFVSIHFAATPAPEVTGPRIYVLSPGTPGDGTVLIPIEQAPALTSGRSLHLATVITSELQKAIPETEMEISRLPIAPLLGITLPAVLIECDFLTSQNALLRQSPEGIERFAQLLTGAIDRFLTEGKNPAP